MAMSNAERQRLYRDRHQLLMGQLELLKNAVCGAFERGRSPHVTNRLSDSPQVWIPDLTARLEEVNAVAHDRTAKRKRPVPKKGLYLRAVRRNPLGIGVLTLYDATRPESKYDRRDGRWVVCCDAHKTIRQCSKMADAMPYLRNPSFCDGCRELEKKP